MNHKITVLSEIGWILVRKNDVHPTSEGALHEFLDAARLYCKPLQDGVKPTGITAREMAEYMIEAHPDLYDECYPVYSPHAANMAVNKDILREKIEKDLK